MKKIILSLMLVFVLLSCTKSKEVSENISVEKKVSEKYELETLTHGELEFQLPKEIELRTKEINENSVYYSISVITLDEYLKLPGYMINSKVNNMLEAGRNVTAEDLKNLLLQNEPDILLSFFALTDIRASYKKIYTNGITGETYFSTGDVPSSFAYSIGYLYNDVIYRIYISTNLPKNMKEIYPEIFMEDNGYLFWKHNPNGKNGRIQAWELISNRDANLPEELILLNDAYEIFLETIKFKNKPTTE